MGLPPYFHSTTLRTLVAEGGASDEGPVHVLAKRAHVDLRLGSGRDARLAGETFVELAARTIGSITIVSSDLALQRELQLEAREINPRISERAVGTSHVVSVTLNDPATAQIQFWGRGWWAGVDDPGPAESNAPVLGPILAGILAFNAAFLLLFAEVLPIRGTTPDVAGWSLRDLSARGADADDLGAVERARFPRTALVGCGAIGQAVTYCLSRSRISGGPFVLIDPQTISLTNLQRYAGSRPGDVTGHVHKAVLAGTALAQAGVPRESQAGKDWAAYCEQGQPLPELVMTALDSAFARRLVQAALPRWIINGWTRTSECGATLHEFDGPNQCLACTYLPRDAATPTNDFTQLLHELGVPPMRVVQLLGGASLGVADLRAVERHRQLPDESLRRWQGESVRSLYGQLCGVVHVGAADRSDYVVPLPQASLLAGVLVAAQALKLVSGLPVGTRPLEVSLWPPPGAVWELPPARKDQFPLACICKDEVYLDVFRKAWPASATPGR